MMIGDSMKTLVGIVIICMLLQCLWHLIRTLKVVNIIKKKRQDSHVSHCDCPSIFVVIPCLEEQKIIEKTIDNFIKAKRLSNMDITLVIVTTSKEKKTSESKLTTLDVVKKKINSDPRCKDIILLNYPNEAGMMAHQLNYALEKLPELISIDKFHSYFAVYNADSRITDNTFRQVQHLYVEQNHPLVMQEYSAFFSNLTKLNFLMKGFAVYQTNFEITNGFTNALLPSKFLRNHVVGHGLFIRYDYLQQIGGFNINFWCEDIYLSFYLKSKAIPIYPINEVEYGESPKQISILIKQNGNWFKTLSENTKIYKELHDTSNRTLSFLYLCNQVRGAIAWVLLPAFYWILLLFLIITRQNILCITFLIVFFVTTTLRYWLSNYIVEMLRNKKLNSKLRLAIFGSLAYTISNLGPIYTLIHLKSKKYKTER